MPATLVDVAPAYVVLRPFSALGRDLVRDEILDCSTWRNVQPLINSRYLKPVWNHVWPEVEVVSTTIDSAPPTPLHRGPGRPKKEAA